MKKYFRALGLCILLGCSRSAFANPFQETIRILENQTSFHWGRDCLVWIVHYPEELVEPWVESEAGRTGMTESDRKAYRDKFVAELSLGKAEPFLFTVYAFGPRALSFSPFSEKIALVTEDGERFKPIRYDRALDQSITGIVQGLVFFPKQNDDNFAISVQGMGVYDERIFAFSGQPAYPQGDLIAEAPSPGESEIVIVELPPAPKTSPPKPTASPQQQAPKQIERPQTPAAPRKEEPVVVVIEPEETESMEDFVKALRAEKPPADESAPTTEREADPQDPENAYVSRERTVRTFLDLWMKHDPGTMYSMLSESSQKLFSRETFESELRKSADFRAALKDGYTLEWLGAERAKIVAAKRILLIRTLVSRTLGVAREGSTWKIVW